MDKIDATMIAWVGEELCKLPMYPYFDAAHYLLMCMNLKDELQADATRFSRKHPISLWISSMLMCFSGGILVNLLMGEDLVTPLKNHRDIMLATAIWYLVFYMPFDLITSLMSFFPLRITICTMKEVQRTHKIYGGVVAAAKLHPGAWVVMIVCGALKGAGSGIMRTFAQLVRGQWAPTNNELLRPSFTTKACLMGALVFTLEQARVRAINTLPHQIVFLVVAGFFVYFKLSALLLGITDPLAPIESFLSAVFFGGFWDSLSRAWNKSRGAEVPKVTKEMKKDQ